MGFGRQLEVSAQSQLSMPTGGIYHILGFRIKQRIDICTYFRATLEGYLRATLRHNL